MPSSSCRDVASFFPGKTFRKTFANRGRSFACSMSVSSHQRMRLSARPLVKVSHSCEYSLRIAVFTLCFTAASVVQENEDGNTVTGWLEYLVDMKGARRERKRDRCYWAYARGHNVNVIVKFVTEIKISRTLPSWRWPSAFFFSFENKPHSAMPDEVRDGHTIARRKK
jgi:hypothetical protein